MSDLSAPPLQSNWIDPPENQKSPDAIWPLSRAAVQWLLSLTTRVQTAATVVKTVSLTGQTAALSATPIPLGILAAGLYRVQWSARITTAAGTSSSLTITIGSTDAGIACSQSGPALTGNTTATVQSGTALIRTDQASAITYATSYASTPAGGMAYQLDVVAEAVSS